MSHLKLHYIWNIEYETSKSYGFVKIFHAHNVSNFLKKKSKKCIIIICIIKIKKIILKNFNILKIDKIIELSQLRLIFYHK